MLGARDVEVRAGGRVLLSEVCVTVSAGDRVGLVGRNGAGKTTLLATLAGVQEAAAGSVHATGSVGYLPQDPRAADPAVTAADRILSVRGLDDAVRRLREAERAMAEGGAERAMAAYSRAEDDFLARGGYAAQAEAGRVAAGLGLPERVMDQAIGTLSGGQRRRVELARILFAEHATLLLDEPTNHLDADSVGWLRGFLRAYPGGLVLVSHDLELIAETVNRVFHLDPVRGALDVHNTGWRTYLEQQAAEERRRARERANAERKAASLRAQADRMRAHVATAVQARNMVRRADRMLAEHAPVRRRERTARIRLPEPVHCGRVPLRAHGLDKSYGDLTVLDGVDLTVDRGSRLVVLGLNGAGKTTLLRILAGVDRPDAGEVVPGEGLRLGYFAQEHDTLDPAATVGRTMAAAAPHLSDGERRGVLGAFLFGGDDADKPTGVLSGGEKTRLALATLVHSGANVLLLDEPTNNLDPASRDEVLASLAGYRGAVVLVSHDEHAIEALSPERVLLLPDAVEDLWSDDYADVALLA